MSPVQPQPTARPSGIDPIADDATDGLRLIDIYVRLIADQHRRLTAYEQAMQEERNQLADMPDQIADLESRIARETRNDHLVILHAKLEEARSEYGAVLRRVSEREADWPALKDEILAEIARYQETIEQIGGEAA